MKRPYALLLAATIIGWACEASSQPSDADVLDQLRKAGSNLQKKHPIEFFFYFPAQAAAQSACSLLESQGYQVIVRPSASTSEFLCKADKPLLPSLEALSELRSQFEALASEMGGEYDGWGTPVVE